MSAALIDAQALNGDESLVWQLSLWPPDLPVPLEQPLRRRHLQLVISETIVVQHAAPLVIVEAAPTPGTFPCTWPGCSRGIASPFETAGRLANHRFAAHGIRSSNEESIARQARRDRKRALTKGTPPPEYIDVTAIETAVKQFLPMNLPPEVREGALDSGEREQLRRRLCYFVQQWMREYRRSPAQLVISVAQIAASGLQPTGLAARILEPEKAFENAPRARLQALGRGRKR